MDAQARLTELKIRAIDGFNHYKPSFDKLNRAYLLALDEDKALSLKERGKANLFIPKLNAKAKRITDSLSETYFNNDEFAKLEGYINSVQKVINKWQEALNCYCDMIRLYKIFMPIFQKIPFLGTAVAKVFWRNGMPVIEEVELDDVYFDPNAKDHDDIRYIVNRISLTYSDIKALARRGVYDKEAVSAILESENLEYERVNVYDIYEQDINAEWQVSTIDEGGAVLRADIKLKDGCPFVIGYMLSQVRAYDESTFVCAYGEPPLASILPLQDEMNFARNAMIDGINRQINPKILMGLSANVSRRDLESAGPTFTADPSAVNIMPPPNLSFAVQNISLIDNEMSEVSGVSPQQNGATTARAETATMSQIMANEGSVRLQGYIRTFNETFFEPLFERLAMLIWRYGAKEFFAGYDRAEVPSFRVTLNTGIGALNKEVQKNSLMQASQALNAHFNLYAQIGDPNGMLKILKANEKVIRDILPLYGIKNTNEYLGDEKKAELESQILGENQNVANDFNQTANAGANEPLNAQQGASEPISQQGI
ncbi:portal protein [Campylobacter gastrosuis]|uniref:Phage head-tail adapter protein n=1 Tax=Campylobacter gastrosuis TaxID=2974576 RepID=A0ABT7HT87_9BACT|nr:phage head-tail adapter protein [Campylobacter gastrosuis]MDL0090069.1 phage head-tail adapter protein [Campylobacter gastrosuis]